MSIKDIVGDLFGFNKDIVILNRDLDKLRLDIIDLEQKCSNVQETLNRTISFKDSKISYLEGELQSSKELNIYYDNILKNGNDELEYYLNSKYPKVDRLYLRHETDGTYQIDVRNYFQVNDSTLPKFTGKSFDDVALKSLKWVIDNITYTPDANEYKENEYWAYPYQTLKNRFGDCEDGAILLANIMVSSGIPYYRVRLNAGSVKGGGHAYVSYCRETDNQWVVLDWCYWANKKPIKDRPTHKEERNYIDTERNYYVWFSWNMKYTFGEQKLPEGLENKFL